MTPENQTTKAVSETVHCKNCNEEFSGRFCPACGQKYIDKRFNIRDGISHIFAMVFNMERGLWHTIVELMRNPGRVMRDYLNGITIPYFHPFRFVFILLTLSVFIMIVTGAFHSVQDQMAVQSTGEHIGGVQQQVMNDINSYLHILLALSLPIFAFASWLLFRSAKLNYAEHLIINCFAYGETVVLTILMVGVYFIDEEAYYYANFVSMPVTMAYFTYAYLSFFKGNRVVVILKAIGAYLVWFVGFAAMITVITILYMIKMVKDNPELMEQFQQNAG